ncbi:protein lifeguard 1-like [Apteryx mantelli]|uniref:Protein lifeguard 1-like n=1 Tax=Apteryx mantelli TaxID=2696672 RepID=A0ABM4E508_9AVES
MFYLLFSFFLIGTSVAITILQTISNKINSATYTFLGTVVGSVILGIISDSHDMTILIQAGGITALASLLLIVLALMTKKSLTSMNISVVSSILLIIGAIVHILIDSSKFQVIYAAFGILFFANDLMKTVAELERQPTQDCASKNYAVTAWTVYIHIAMLFFFLLLVDDIPLHSLFSFIY